MADEAKKEECMVKKTFKELKEQQKAEELAAKEKRIHDKIEQKQVQQVQKAAVKQQKEATKA